MAKWEFMWQWCTLLLLLLLSPSFEHECGMNGVQRAPTSNDPHFATDCIPPETLKAASNNKWTPESDYSYGGLDDFCLHTQISDTKNIYESRRRTYRGIGANFKIIEKLQRGNAWSFQRDGIIETVNMDWEFPKQKYKEIMDKVTQDYLKDQEAHDTNKTLLENIRRIYEDKLWLPGQTEFESLNNSFWTGHARLYQMASPPASVPAGYWPSGHAMAGQLGYFEIGTIETVQTYYPAGLPPSRYRKTRKEMLDIIKPIEAEFEDEGINDPVNPMDPKHDKWKVSTHPEAVFYLDIKNWMQNHHGGLWRLYREVEYFKWRRERFLDMHRQILGIGELNATVGNCGNFTRHVQDHFKQLKHLIDNLENNPLAAEKDAPNPFFVEASAITVNHELLKNFLHIRVFMNRSVSDDKPRLHTKDEREDKAKGRMKAVIIIVKDQEGFPVGDFGRPIPCSSSCNSYSGPIHRHESYRNDLPCVFTPPTANTHPGIYVWPGSEGPIPDDHEGIRELHATWNFAQDSCNFVTELHIQTLILEDLELELPGTDRFDFKDCFAAIPRQPPCTGGTAAQDLVNHLNQNCLHQGRGHLFGWTGRYNILHPTLSSMGAPDYVNIPELTELNRRGGHINCHVPLKDEHGFTKGHVPKRMSRIPTMAPYFLELMSEFHLDNQDLDVLYYGTHYNGRLQCREPVLNDGAGESAVLELKNILSPPHIEEFMKTPGIRCPCPALPSTPDPAGDSVTADPSRLHGRLLHASHMSLAWMLLVPLSIFVVRYYKETFSLVFCIQEYWWLAWHIGLLFASAVFIMGGILAVAARKNLVNIVAHEELVAHRILGTFSIILFYIQIFTGFFRTENHLSRMRQIFVHWVLGILNQVIAAVSIVLMGFGRETGMSCKALYTAGAWFVFYATMFVIMEVHMRAVDKRLELTPKRTYAPPPMKRLFGRDAPNRNFRTVMLGIFIIGMLTFYICMAYFIWFSDGVSCQEERLAALDEDYTGPAATAESETDYVYVS